MLGEVPEGQWAVFSLPDGVGMISVVVPQTIWRALTRSDPFSSEIALMTKVGLCALERCQKEGRLLDPVWVEAIDLPMSAPVAGAGWYSTLGRCGQCQRMVPTGEVLEGLANALPPDSRGEVEIQVLCPDCGVQTGHRLSPWGIPKV